MEYTLYLIIDFYGSNHRIQGDIYVNKWATTEVVKAGGWIKLWLMFCFLRHCLIYWPGDKHLSCWKLSQFIMLTSIQRNAETDWANIFIKEYVARAKLILTHIFILFYILFCNQKKWQYVFHHLTLFAFNNMAYVFLYKYIYLFRKDFEILIF